MSYQIFKIDSLKTIFTQKNFILHSRFICFCTKNHIFSRCTICSLASYIHRRSETCTDDKPTSTFYLSIKSVCMYMYMCALLRVVCVCMSRSPSIFGINKSGNIRERKTIIVGTSKQKKGILYYIPVAVEDRQLFIGFNYYR